MSLDRVGVGPGQTVLDIGFGKASELLTLSEIVGRQGKVYGVEPDPFRVRETSRQLPQDSNIRVLRGNAFSVPLPDYSVDVVIFKGVLHEIKDVSKSLKEAKRVCRINGKVIVIDFSRFPTSWLRKSNLKWRLGHPKRLLGPALDKHPGFSKTDLEAYVRNSGLLMQTYREDFTTGHCAGHDIPLFLAVARPS